jgi:hypothetical protein
MAQDEKNEKRSFLRITNRTDRQTDRDPDLCQIPQRRNAEERLLKKRYRMGRDEQTRASASGNGQAQ